MVLRSVMALVLVFLGGSAYVGLAADDSPAAVSQTTLLGHNLFFSLKEPTEENKAKLIEACKKYLSQHPGIVFFAVGTRDEKLSGGFNDKNYDVALHMIFTGREALGTYARSADHQQFIRETTPLFKGLRIFDSTVEAVANKSDAAK
jgi:hypothetical protein